MSEEQTRFRKLKGDVLKELYDKLSRMQIDDEDFELIVHSIQEIQHLRNQIETYRKSIGL
jgi:coenzyme F420-reducing hydrogenase delta subunit